MINRDALAEIVKENLEVRVSKVMRDNGYQINIVYKMFSLISNIYKIMPPELIRERIRIIMPFTPWDYSKEQIIYYTELKDLMSKSCSIICVSASTCILKPYDESFDENSVIQYFYYAPLNEQLYIGKDEINLPEYVESSMCSVFAPPVYKELEDSLSYYDETVARHTVCAYLEQIWKGESRLLLKDKPEHFMRDSLYAFLRSVLRNHTVKREQNVDATHPVDIKVIWHNIVNVALIEIKWTGDSEKTKYRDRRANEGAKQLIDYISASKCEEPDKNFLGYLVVFDARRGKAADQYKERRLNVKEEYLLHPSMRIKRFYLSQFAS